MPRIGTRWGREDDLDRLAPAGCDRGQDLVDLGSVPVSPPCPLPARQKLLPISKDDVDNDMDEE